MHQLQIWKLEASAYPRCKDPDIKKLLEIDVYVLASAISYQLHNRNYQSIFFCCCFLFVYLFFFFQTGQVLHGHSSSISESEEFKKAVQKVGDIHLTIIQ